MTMDRPRELDAGVADGLMRRLNADAVRIAGHFGLIYRSIVPEHRTASHYGICYEDGLIKIRLEHARRGTALKYSSLVHTLCHELSHLRHFNHGPRFRRFLEEVLAWSRRQGIYRPGARSPAPVTACGVTPEERESFLAEMRRAAAHPTVRSRPSQRRLFGD
jgi:hypothetical protein